MEKASKKPVSGGAQLLAAAAAAIVVVSCASAAAGGDGGGGGVPAMYVFGDSLVDVGNNDFLPLPAPRAGPPCGVDLPDGFAGRRTGRFTNGYNLADIVAQEVGFNMSPPAYLSLTLQTSIDLLRGRVGANYASAGSGILDDTGNGTISLREQIQLFADTKARMIIAGERLDRLLSRSLFVACTGGNDFAAFSDGRVDIGDAPAYIAGMAAAYVERIRALYELGARRVAVLDVLPIGCVPRMRSSSGACDGVGNSLARRFNALLRREMAAEAAAAGSMPGLAYSVGSVYNVFSDIIADPGSAGMEEVASACCGGGRLNAEEECSARSSLCADRAGYAFWDKVHGTQAAYRRAVLAVFRGRTARYAEPVSFEQLVVGEPAGSEPPGAHEST